MSAMHIYFVFLLLAVAIISSSTGKQPNIIFILADDYGFHDIGYHNSEIKTPNLDKLATAGVKLENYYVQPICTPTRSQFMSGRYQIHTGLQHGIIWASQPNGLPLDSATIADKIREAGYTPLMLLENGIWVFTKMRIYLPTGDLILIMLISLEISDAAHYHAIKWHDAEQDQQSLKILHSANIGYLTGSEDYYTHYRCDNHNASRRENPSGSGKLDVSYCGLDLRENTTPVFNESGHYSANLFTERAVDVIKNHDQSKPFFMYLAYQSVHGPLQVPDKYMEPYKSITNMNRRTYAGMTACMDEGIGNITDTLKATGQWDNTLIVFSTDNGGQIYAGGNNWPLRGWKASLWEGGFHGVGFVHGEMLKNKGTVSHELIHVSDWFPTLVGVAGGNTNGTKPLDGFNQWNTISNGEASPRKELLHNIDILEHPRGRKMFNNTFDNRIRAAIRVGDWKLITGNPGNGSWIPPPHLSKHLVLDAPNPDKNLWLFNIAKDPNEHKDLSATNTAMVKKLLDRLAYYQSTAVPPVYPDPDPNCDPKKHGGVWGPWM